MPKRATIIICLSCLLAISFMVITFQKETQKSQLPVIGQVYDFTLMDSNGDPFSLKQLYGHVWIVNFMFTTCSDICPLMTKNMASLHRSFDLVKEVQLVSVTVNPEQDSSAVMATYAKKHKANTRKWHFLTGERATIKDLALKSFKLGSIEEPVFHSSYFSLVDQDGLIRGYYDGTDTQAISRLFKDAAGLVK